MTDATASSAFAVGAQRALDAVAGLPTWATVLVWLLLFWLLPPLLIVARTGGSRNGLIGAGAMQAYLNNDGDTIRLLDRSEVTVDTFSY